MKTKTKAPPRLWDRGSGNRQNWYLRLPIPKPLRQHFRKGNREPLSIIKPLDTDSLADALRLRDELVVAYRRVFDRLEAGEAMTIAQIEAATAITAKFDPGTESVVRAFGGESFVRFLRETAIAGGVPLDTITALTNVRTPTTVPEGGETVTQALEAWLAEGQGDEATVRRTDTIKGHRGRVRAFTDKYGDLPLTSITRIMASDFLAGLKCKNQTKNQYAMTLKAIIASARKRGRFPKVDDNPFDAQRRAFSRTKGDRYTDQEVVTLINAFGPRQVKPAKHTVDTALPWAVLIAAHSGLGLEEVSQLAVGDIKTVGGNGSSVVCFDIHNGDPLHHLKNDETRPREIPIHSQLVGAGLLDYVKALPQDGRLFPGLKRRADGTLGTLLGKTYNKKRRELGIDREDKKIDFHSWRHTVASKMDEAGIPESHMNAVLGHAQKTETTRTYSHGPGIHNLKVAVEAIRYEGLSYRRWATPVTPGATNTGGR
jgi:integrase